MTEIVGELKNVEKLIDVLGDLHLRMSVEDFLNKLLDAAIKVIPEVKRGVVLLEGESQKWRVAASRDIPEDLLKLEFDISAMKTAISEEPLIIKDPKKFLEGIFKEKGILEKLQIPKSRGMVGVGINVDGSIKGGFFLGLDEPPSLTLEQLRLVKAFGKLASIFISMKLFQERERGYQREIILAMVKAMEARDPYTVGHSERVAIYAAEIAKAAGCERKTVDRIYWGALIHDIGKLAVPEYILLKPGPLFPHEYEIVKKHPVVGVQMIKDYPWLEELIPIVRNHHEKWNGEGYPDGLKAEEIPIFVRIVTIADAFDAMTSERAYRKAMELEEALEEIRRQREKQFDPSLVEIAIPVLEKYFPIIKKIE